MNNVIFLCFVLPVILGIVIRFLLRKWRKAYLVTGAFALLSLLVWIWTRHLVSHGTDGTLLLWAVMTAELAAGSLLTGGFLWLVQRTSRGKAANR
ncbi:MAG: hypothetical protein E7458_05630 [Ruminococcaceae bacterium]|nr:hypothetical protein [Oscillospiraceae bacterium]